MNCKEFEKDIPSFLHNQMDYFTMEEFQSHMKSCSACKEELSIQFLVTEGLKHLERGDAFDLDGEFNSRIETTRRKHNRKKYLLNSYQWIITLVLFLAGAALIIIFG